MSLIDPQCEINTHTGEVVFNGKSMVLRPKTFQLFSLLSSKPKTVFSKDEILASVWQGSIVEDQVIFQSINEIRKELGNPDVIKTYPRRGYSIGVQVSVVTQPDNNTSNSISTAKAKQSHKHLKVSVISLASFVVTLALFFGAASFFNNTYFEPITSQNNADKTKPVHQGILILPFDVNALDTPLQWLRYGAMEGVINNINPNNDMTIFHLEDAIEILNRVPVGQRNNIHNLFERSGASHILTTTVTGTVGDLTFIVNIHSRSDRVSETINVMSPDDAYSQIVSSIEKVINKRLKYDEIQLDKKLQNDLIAKAVQFMELGDLSSAATFVKSAVINEPDNMLALYLFTKINLEMGAIDEVLQTTTRALTQIMSGADATYKPRLLYFKGIAQLSKGEFEIAEQNLLAAYDTARVAKDWLYVAYSQSMLGTLSQMQQRYDNALKMFSLAMQYQELLNCPLGITQAYIDFAGFYLKKGERGKAEQHLEKAKHLALTKKLLKAYPLIEELESKFKQSTIF